jgi:ubiquinone/menaquinone biosynthesis C-methylase UbiE
MSEPTPAERAFREFEHAGWQRAAAAYGPAFAGVTSQAVDPLLDAAGVGAGTSVLDVATGPGHVAAAAALRTARAVGVDFAEAMLAEARRLHPGLDFRLGDAEALPFEPASFDALTMNFGLLHLARPERALAEAARVLRAGGRAALTVWAPPEEAVLFGIVLDAVQTHGSADVALPLGPPFFRFSERVEFERALVTAGFVDPRVTKVPMILQVASEEELLRGVENGTARTGPLLRAQPSEARASIEAAIRAALRRYVRPDGGLALPMPCVLASGTKRV